MTQEHLTAADASLDPQPILDLLAKYESAYELDPASDVQDSFVVGALQSLTFAPYPEYLRPANWNVKRPSLDIEVRVTSKNELAIDVRPWADKVSRNGASWKFEDFVEFPEPTRPGQPPRMTAFRLELEDLALEVRNTYIQDDDDRAIVRRRLVFACYEFVVKRLAHPFTCRIQTALMCVGPNAQLLLRQPLLANPVERANLPPDGRDFLWHGRFLRLCSEFSVSPEELLEFYRGPLMALEPYLHNQSLREFLGRPVEIEEDRWQYSSRRQSSRKRDVADVRPLLEVLHVVSDPEGFPPLRAGGAPELDKLLARRVRAGERFIGALSLNYLLDEADVRQFLREHYPHYLVAALSARELMAELETLSKQGAEAEAKAAPFKSALLPALRRAWDEEAERPYSARMTRLLRRMGFSSQTEALVWMRTHVPAAVDWMVSLKPARKRNA